MILPIVLYPSTLLRTVAKPVSEHTPNLSTLAANMFETMYNAQGVGLAAPQIGQSLQLFVVGGKLSEDKKLSHYEEVFINPRIVHFSTDTTSYKEGCLSVPEVNVEVQRASEVQIVYENLERKLRKQALTDLLARIIQHEYDHLKGVLFIDKISALSKRLLKKKLEQVGQKPLAYPTQTL